MNDRAFTQELVDRGLYDVAKEIGLVEHVTVEELGGTSRFPHVVRARNALVLYLHDKGWSSTAIGTLLGRDHSTIRHAMIKHDGPVVRDRRIAKRRKKAASTKRPGA
jgi:chromosomal replication initiation ATPase DnaA